MDPLYLLGALEISRVVYDQKIKNLVTIDLEYVITQENIVSDELHLEIDLNDRIALKDDFNIINHIINVKLPRTVFPNEKDQLFFEYIVLLVNSKTKATKTMDLIIRLQLFDTIVN